MATKEQIAWAAGLFEGEGCFTISTTTSPRANGKLGFTKQIHSKLSMKDEDVVRRFHSIVGFGSVVLLKQRNKKYSALWLWQVGKVEDARRLYLLFAKYLGKRRRERAEEVLSTMDEYKSRPFMSRGIIRD